MPLNLPKIFSQKGNSKIKKSNMAAIKVKETFKTKLSFNK